ncbi:hypothetical protein [Microbacterium murale]|uniref:Uncharacterized protein n=1 Tax=Microbacterium murale TaxID=1081040 RepID=A0ABU0P7K6_9MICO|nr:hypothetical protein [Microbacterium murale]MDQ0643319.1 hypothetical protein [Microbacterium murale]
MLNIIAADTWSSEAIWRWFSAQRALNEAITALEDAGAGLLPLVDASDWQADGVRALHTLIVDLKARATVEVGVLSSRLWELEASGRS